MIKVITVKTRMNHPIVLLLTNPISLCIVIITVIVQNIIIGYFFPFVLDLLPSCLASPRCYDGLISQQEWDGILSEGPLTLWGSGIL
jgi:hypothetical protein